MLYYLLYRGTDSKTEILHVKAQSVDIKAKFQKRLIQIILKSAEISTFTASKLITKIKVPFAEE
ncbi:hypothetical protein ACE38V_19170 [Cytobacillus sp. Hz8]|uniref:hypothetical protein n=1 Tax=Cytobacillus sp. Hz8 TaxID=3347168 RepID=UPI0035DF6808